MTDKLNQQRFVALDALRGLAVMGILLMNIINFALPELAYLSPLVYGGSDPADLATWTFTFIFVDGKMRGLFTLLFGASMMLIIERASAAGQDAASIHFSRMLWLAIFGLIHFFFIWSGDILFLYATIGAIAFLLRDYSAEDLIRHALLIFLTGAVILTTMFGSLLMMQYQAGLPGATGEEIASYQEIAAGFAILPSDIQAEIALHQSGFIAIFLDKIDSQIFDPLINIAFNFSETLPLMMIGMALYKNGFLIGGWPTQSYRRWGIGATAIGAFIMLPITAILYLSNFDIIWVTNASYAWTAPARILMTIGYAALLMLLIRRYQSAIWLQRVAAVGRAAFTNYLGTSILMTFIFYGWGLGLFGTIGRWQLYAIVFATWALMLSWSKPWLEHFRYGPLEWLWRSLARGQLQPMQL